MSPVTHAAIGWILAQPLAARRDRALVTAAALLPDIDGLTVLAGADAYGTYHHTFGHNVFMAAAATIACAVAGRSRWAAAFWGMIGFHSHLVGDLLGSGAGWPILYWWPLSHAPFHSMPPFQWELASWQNVLITTLCLAVIGWLGVTKGRTIFELVSPKADDRVVGVLRSRLRSKKAK